MKLRYDKEKEKFTITEGSRTEYHQLKLWLSRHVKGYRFMQPFKMGVWNGKKDFFKNGSMDLGLWKEIFNACKEIQTPFIVENKEDFPLNRNIKYEDVEKFTKEYFKNHKVKIGDKWENFMPYEHQIQTAYNILKNRYCLAEVATSGGKSLIIAIIMFYTLTHIDPNAKFLMIVPSISLVTQFYDDILEYRFGANTLEDISDDKLDALLNDKNYINLRVEEIMSDKPRKYSGNKDANLYIGTYQSLEKWPKEFFTQFHTVITDEAHKSKAATLQKILKRTIGHAYSRFGVSGTFPPEDSCEILEIQSVLGPKIAEVSADELKKKGIITPMEIKAVVMNHEDPGFYEKVKYLRKNGLGKEAFNLERDYIHLSDNRIGFIKKIIKKVNNNTLLLFHTIEYGEKLFNELQKEFPDKLFFYIDGSVKSKERERIKKEMEIVDNKDRILVASYGTMSTGVSIRAIFNIIFTDSFKSMQIVIQSIGRGLRLHSEKDKVTIFDLIDVYDSKDFGNILYSHFKERIKFYNNRKYPYTVSKINLK